MAKHNPEQEAFKQRDQVNDGQQDDASQRLSLEANAAASNDKVSQKAEEFKVADGGDSVEKALVGLLTSIAEKASRLPQEMRDQLVAGNADFINPALLAVVKNPQQFKLGDQQNPEAVTAFLARVQNA